MLGRAVLWLLAFPVENSSNFSSIALGQERYLIKYNLIFPITEEVQEDFVLQNRLDAL